MESNDTSSTETQPDRATDDRSAAAAERSERENRNQREGTSTLPDRYATLALMDGAKIIYDREEPEGWIQSDTTRSLEQVL